MACRPVTRILLPSAFAAALLAAGCSDEECTGYRTTLPTAQFFLPGGERVALDSASVYGIGAPGDSLLADGERNLDEIYLPFNLDADEGRFVVRDDRGGIADTITFRYTKDPWFESASCGVVYIYNVESVSHTSHMIDSVVCKDMRIDNMPGAPISVYFRPGQHSADSQQQ